MDAPPVDGLGAEVEARLDLETIHIEAVAGLDEDPVLAIQIPAAKAERSASSSV